MTASTRLICIICAVFFLFVFTSIIRKRSIKPFYSFLWLMISMIMFGIIIFEKAIKHFVTLIGFPDANSIVFIGVILFLMIYVLHLSIIVSELSDRVQELISYVGIMDKHEPKNSDQDLHNNDKA